jgi:hypothetical protein
MVYNFLVLRHLPLNMISKYFQIPESRYRCLSDVSLPTVPYSSEIRTSKLHEVKSKSVPVTDREGP